MSYAQVGYWASGYAAGDSYPDVIVGTPRRVISETPRSNNFVLADVCTKRRLATITDWSSGSRAGSRFEAGTVLALDPEAGFGDNGVEAWPPMESGGEWQSAAGILLSRCESTASKYRLGEVLVGGAEVIADALIWPAAMTDEQKLAGIAQLRAVGILVRNS